MKVYTFSDEKKYDPRFPAEDQECYQELEVVGTKNYDRLEEYRTQYDCFQGKAIGDIWQPVEVRDYESTDDFPIGDFPYLHGFGIVPVFSDRAVEVLSDLLQGNGEILPLTCSIGTYYAFNVTKVVDVLDEAHSEFKPLQELDPDIFWKASPDQMGVTRFEFFSEKVADLSIFRIPFGSNYAENYPLVTDRFVQRVEAAGLKGFEFQLLWSPE